jgi:putative nucleotidyltransferase-like protein
VTPQGAEVCLELHRALWSPRFFAADDGVWERRAVAELRGVPIGVLSPEDMLLHLAIHRTRSPLRLRLVCDMAELVRRLGPTLAWGEVVQRAHALGARAALHSALTLTGSLLGAPAPPGVLGALAVSPLKRRLLERTCGVQALFREARPGDLDQQQRLALRAFEQDGGARIARTLAAGVVRKGHKARFHTRRRRRASVAPAVL